MYDPLASIDRSKSTWQIKARVTRLWKSMTVVIKEDGTEVVTLHGYNLILLDDDNFHLHAFVFKDVWNSLIEPILEGQVYIITNFYTKQAAGKLKPVSSKFSISFTVSTYLQPVMNDNGVIHRHKFEFVDLGDLIKIATEDGNTEFATDIIGVVEDYEKMKISPTKNGERPVVRFRISDGRNWHRVTVWGDAAIQIAEHYEVENLQRPPIAIITTSVQIQTTTSSKAYVNIDNDDIAAMRERLIEEAYALPPDALFVQNRASQVLQKLETLSLTELFATPTSTFSEKIIVSHIKVAKIEEDELWWFNSCNICHQEIVKVEGRFKCEKCSRVLPFAEKRYKVVILGEDESEACNIILKDRAAKKMIGKTASKVLAESLKASSSFAIPASIQAICGKQFALVLALNDEGENAEEVQIFYAIDVYDFDNTAPSSSTTPFPEYSSYNAAQDGYESHHLGTPGSVTSVNKKAKKVN